jgi:hypothetical protein
VKVLPALVLATVLAQACSGPAAPGASAPSPTAAPSTAVPPSASASPTASPAAPLWVVGASPLPRRPDGFGEVLPTPRVLRVRRLPTHDVLPPPADGQFHATVGPVGRAVRLRMGTNYQPGCPVGLAQLRYLTLTFWGFDGRAHTGELVVAARAAPSAVRAFRRLFAMRFPIEEMRLPTTADREAPPTGDGNDTVGFACRTARGQTRFSAHAYGLAIDVDPFQNPFVRDALVLPELAGAYVNRAWERPGMFLRGSAAVRAFTREGWTWGGDFRRPKDYQHFSLTGD